MNNSELIISQEIGLEKGFIITSAHVFPAEYYNDIQVIIFFQYLVKHSETGEKYYSVFKYHIPAENGFLFTINFCRDLYKFILINRIIYLSGYRSIFSEINLSFPDVNLSLPKLNLSLPGIKLVLSGIFLSLFRINLSLSEIFLSLSEIYLSLPGIKRVLSGIFLSLYRINLSLFRIYLSLTKMILSISGLYLSLPGIKLDLFGKKFRNIINFNIVLCNKMIFD